MKKFLASLFPKWINDKGKHAILGTLIYLCAWWWFDGLTALIVVFAVAAITELYDYISKKGTPEAMDGIWTVAIPIILYLLWQI